MKASKYLRFFSRSVVTRLFYGVLVSYDTESVMTTLISKMHSSPLSHKSLIRRFPFCYELTSIPGGLLRRLETDRKAFLICTACPVFISGSSRTCMDVRAFLDRSDTPSCSLLWQYVTRLSFLHLSACAIQNATLQPSQWGVRSGVSMWYWRNINDVYII